MMKAYLDELLRSEVSRQSKVAFGTASVRIGYPLEIGKSMFCNTYGIFVGTPEIGPGKYDVCVPSTLLSKHVSKIGYGFGARTEPRNPKRTVLITPAPGHYNIDRIPYRQKAAFKPFNSGLDRHPTSKRDRLRQIPGVGYYDVQRYKSCPRVSYQQEFGATPTNIPPIQQYCVMLKNINKLPASKDERRYHEKVEYFKQFFE